MKFEKDNSFAKYGKVTGFVLAYFLFSTVLFLVLRYVGHAGLNYAYVLYVTMIIALAGYAVKRLLK